MSVFSLKSYYPGKNRDFSASHKKSETFLLNCSKSAYSNLRNKLISFDFMQNFKKKNLNASNLTVKGGTNLFKCKNLNFSLSNASKSSINLAKTLEKTYFSLRKGHNSLAYFEVSTDRKRKVSDFNEKILKYEYSRKKHVCCENSDKKGEFVNEKEEFLCSKCSGKQVNQGQKRQNSSLLFQSKIESLLNQINEVLPNIRIQEESLDFKKEDISRFYENQMLKIKAFYQDLIQRLQSEKLALLHSFSMHKTRTFQVYDNFKREIIGETKDLEVLKAKLRENCFENLEEISLKTQEKTNTAKLNLNARNNEFLSIFRTSGLNEKRLDFLKKSLFPMFEIAQIPTSILKRNPNKGWDLKENQDYYFSFEGNQAKNETSMKFKMILEKIKRNQTRNSEFYLKKGEKRKENWGKRVAKAKSMPTFYRKSMEIKINEEPRLTVIESFKEKDSNNQNTSQETFRRKIYCSPNFKETL